jgi:hypothetical protein
MQNLSPKIEAHSARRVLTQSILALLAASYAILSPTAQAVAAKAPTKAVDKYEYKVEFNGTSTLLIAEDGAIWRIPRIGITYYCMAPAWEVIVFNDATKRGRVFPRQHWLNRDRRQNSNPNQVKICHSIFF